MDGPSNDFSSPRDCNRTVIDEADPDSEFWEESEDAWPDEPDEFDPHSLGPEIPEAPDPPDPTSDEVEASPELLRAFWAAVVFANIGLFCVSLGPMLVYFEGRTDLGLGVFLVGVLSFVFTYRHYHGYVHGDEEDDPDGDGPNGSSDGGSTSDSGGGD